MNNRVLLIGGNYAPEQTGIGKYNGEMIDWLAAHNFECIVITTFPYYPQWKVQDPYTKKRFWYKKEIRKNTENSIPVKIIRCPHYVPKNPSGLKRILSDFTFLFSSYLVIVLFLFLKKINYVISVAPSFSIGLLGILYKKIRHAKFLYHIQDLQIEAAQDLNIIKSSYFLNVFFALENYILSQADVVSTISEGMIQKVRKKCNKEVIYFPNWVDTISFYPIPNDIAKISYGFKPSDKIILYSGAMGFKQELAAIIYTAKSFEASPDIKFVICGSGPYKFHLQQLTELLCVNNVIFMPLQPYEKLNCFLNMADIHLVLQKKHTADLVMPSKLTTILSVGGLAIVTASQDTYLYEFLKSNNLCILIDPDEQEILYKSIKDIIETDYTNLKKSARSYAEKNLSNDNVLFEYTEKALTAKYVLGKIMETKSNPFSKPGQNKLQTNNKEQILNAEGINEGTTGKPVNVT